MNTYPTGEKTSDEPNETVNPNAQPADGGVRPQPGTGELAKPETTEKLQAGLESVETSCTMLTGKLQGTGHAHGSQ